MNINSKVAVVLDHSALEDHGAFPVILHKDTIVHIMRYFTVRDLKWHWKFFQEKKCIFY